MMAHTPPSVGVRLLLAVARVALCSGAGAGSQLECLKVEVTPREVVLPCANLTVSVTVRNTGASAAIMTKADPAFMSGQHDVSRSFHLEPVEGNPIVVGPGRTETLRFAVETFHDTPTGQITVVPAVEWYALADNLLASASGTGLVGKEDVWHTYQTSKEMAGSWAFVEDPALAKRGVPEALQWAVMQNLAKGVVSSDSRQVALKPGGKYVAGVWYRSDRSAWGDKLDKGLTVLQYGEEGALREQHLHLCDTLFWNREYLRFTALPNARAASLSLWMRAYELRQTGSLWWGPTYLLPEDRLRPLKDSLDPGSIEIATDDSTHRLPGGDLSPVVYLADDWETQGDWPGRYGTYAYILCGMRQYNLVGGVGWPLSLRVRTSDPKVQPARWIWPGRRDDPSSLWNPWDRGRTACGWDDRGETHPFDGKGPDLFVDLGVPRGLYRLSLYWPADRYWWDTPHRVAYRFRLGDGKDTVYCGGRVAEMDRGVYKQFAVRGPVMLTLRVLKDRSSAAGIGAMFLDKLAGLAPSPAGAASEDMLAKRLGLSPSASGTDPSDWKSWLAVTARAREAAAQAETLLADPAAHLGFDQWCRLAELLRDFGATPTVERCYAKALEAAAAKDLAAVEQAADHLLRADQIRSAQPLLSWLLDSGALDPDQRREWARRLFDVHCYLGDIHEARAVADRWLWAPDDPALTGSVSQRLRLLESRSGPKPESAVPGGEEGDKT